MTERPFITNRKTGQRYYIDDREPHCAPPLKSFVPDAPAPPIYIECELCAHPQQQVEWTREPPPFICMRCTAISYGIGFDEVSWPDHQFLGRAHAAMRALQAEAVHAR